MKKKVTLLLTAAVAVFWFAGSFAYATAAPKTMEHQVEAFTCELKACDLKTEHTHALCPQTNCSTTTPHSHDGTIYFGHYEDDGHNHKITHGTPVAYYKNACDIPACPIAGEHTHSICDKEDCTVTVPHTHAGSRYYAHHDEDGHSYHRTAETAQAELSGTELADNAEPVSATPVNSCGVAGCTNTAQHSHAVNSCGVSGCYNTAQHSHAVNSCGVSGCYNTASHSHAVSSCGVSGCYNTASHSHSVNSCGVNGCYNSGSHSHHNGNQNSGNTSPGSGNSSGHHSQKRGHH